MTVHQSIKVSSSASHHIVNECPRVLSRYVGSHSWQLYQNLTIPCLIKPLFMLVQHNNNRYLWKHYFWAMGCSSSISVWPPQQLNPVFQVHQHRSLFGKERKRRIHWPGLTIGIDVSGLTVDRSPGKTPALPNMTTANTSQQNSIMPVYGPFI